MSWDEANSSESGNGGGEPNSMAMAMSTEGGWEYLMEHCDDSSTVGRGYLDSTSGREDKYAFSRASGGKYMYCVCLPSVIGRLCMLYVCVAVVAFMHVQGMISYSSEANTQSVIRDTSIHSVRNVHVYALHYVQ